MESYSRRTLVLCSATAVALAGCLGSGDDTDGSGGDTDKESGNSDDTTDDAGGNERRLEANGTVVVARQTEIVVEAMGTAEVVRLERNSFGAAAELTAAGESASPPAGIYPVVADPNPEDALSDTTTLGRIQVGEVAFTVDTWEEGETEQLSNAAIDGGALVQQDPDKLMEVTFALDIDATVGEMQVCPDERMESEADAVLQQPGATYGFFVDPEQDCQGSPAGEAITEVFDPGTYTLAIDSDPAVSPPSEGIVALDRVEFYAGDTITIRG